MPKDLGFFSVKNEVSKKETEVFIYKTIGNESYWDDDIISAETFNKAIAEIPQDNNIVLRINSPGGNVYAGLAIYNYLLAYKERTVCVIDGMCGSIATIIACAAGKVIMNLGSIYAIHKPWSYISGNADDLRKSAEDLDKILESLVDIYEEKTKLKRDEIIDLMAKTTLFSDKEAQEKGFVDEISKAKTTNEFDLGCFKNNFTGLPVKQKDLENTITSKGINKMPNSSNPAPGATPNPADPTNPVPVNNSVVLSPDEYQALLASKTFADQVKAKEAEAKKTEITNMANSLVNGGIISNTLMNQIITDAVRSDSHYNMLRDMHDNFTSKAQKQNAPSPTPGLQVLNTGKINSLPDLLKARNNMLFENDHKGFNKLLVDNKDFIRESLIRNEIAVAPELKRDYIMKNMVVQEFGKILVNLNDIFTCIFKSVPLEGTSIARIPYYPDDNQDAKDFKYRGTNGGVGEGYQWDGDYTAGEVDVELDCYKYVDLRYSDRALAQLPFINMEKILSKKGENLAYQCWKWLLQKITAASYTQVYPEGGAGISLAKWNYDALVNLKTQLDNASVPVAGRSLIMNANYGNELLKGRVLQNSDTVGAMILTKATIKELSGFNLVTVPNLPHNDEKLVGFATVAESLFVINQPSKPDDIIPLQYQTYTDEATGLTLEWTRSGDAKMRETNIALEVHMGAKVGNAKALTRITKP
ncbi:MAG: Clp protease ClpP [Verrucomicrobiae bacterium]|nr:Clp protease ClpP [Verrucomicrobiae bacterium]